ncbi:hypothetical protein K443DRAFT_419156 [Laccaria amethystina LaAM-08-1]|uniref:Unplaced genomic scaffold K443scaffold_343, whole genome shotgun sequence n=1 Tax=Laccaria amethystina LaAM-08-1 TaxID=1095629 RepID=A0A0C9X5F6_9AGAR|nr:hypothetical protein K443DRAFT_419156 [Laccaria amethystina LaAM-08-1]
MNSPQTPSMFRALGDALYVLSEESSLRKRAHSPAGDEPTPTRGLLVSVVNLSAATRSKTFCKKRTTIISEGTIAKNYTRSNAVLNHHRSRQLYAYHLTTIRAPPIQAQFSLCMLSALPGTRISSAPVLETRVSVQPLMEGKLSFHSGA